MKSEIVVTNGNRVLAGLFSTFCFLWSVQSLGADFGCSPEDFVEMTGNVTIQIKGSSYHPRCVKIKAGSAVAIAASSHHPLQGVLNLSAQNPIYDELGGVVQSTSYEFQEEGLFGFYCVAHGDDTGAGMAGAIQVVP